MFRVYDYTNATRLFGEEFVTHAPAKGDKPDGSGPDGPMDPPERTILVDGFDVRVSDAGRYIVTMVDGRATPVTVEEHKARLAARLVEEAPSLDAFRARWITPAERRELLERLPDGGRSARLVRELEGLTNCDLYDVLADLAYGMAAKSRAERAASFGYKHAGWLAGLPPETAATLNALVAQFERAGTEGLETPEVFQTPEVVRAGGLAALKALGKPADVLREAKERLFVA